MIKMKGPKPDKDTDIFKNKDKLLFYIITVTLCPLVLIAIAPILLL